MKDLRERKHGSSPYERTERPCPSPHPHRRPCPRPIPRMIKKTTTVTETEIVVTVTYEIKSSLLELQGSSQEPCTEKGKGKAREDLDGVAHWEAAEDKADSVREVEDMLHGDFSQELEAYSPVAMPHTVEWSRESTPSSSPDIPLLSLPSISHQPVPISSPPRDAPGPSPTVKTLDDIWDVTPYSAPTTMAETLTRYMVKRGTDMRTFRTVGPYDVETPTMNLPEVVQKHDIFMHCGPSGRRVWRALPNKTGNLVWVVVHNLEMRHPTYSEYALWLSTDNWAKWLLRKTIKTYKGRAKNGDPTQHRGIALNTQ